MSRTLFWYVFRDLLKVFLMASGAIAGIMSFGGLLRPLTQNGLGGADVLRLLTYFLPAMSTYSLPIAALFATTVVYGRMAADNEQTACRASGISFLFMASPAILLGLLVSMASLYMLCFTVPSCTMRIERTIYSNLARIIAHEIEQTHETHFEKTTVFAQSAELPPQDPKSPNRQSVILRAPVIVKVVTPPGKDKWFHVPKEICTARSATMYIDEDPDDSTANLTATLIDGVVLPRRFTDPNSRQGGVGTGQFGPIQIPSRMGEKPKFMNIFQLKQLEKDPTRGHDVRSVTVDFIAEDQAGATLRNLLDQLNGPTGRCTMVAGGETYSIARGGATAIMREGRLVLETPADAKAVLFQQESGGQIRLSVEAKIAHVSAEADTANDQTYISIDLKDALVDAGDTPVPQAEFTRRFVQPMTLAISSIKARTALEYLENDTRAPKDHQRIVFAMVDLINHIRSEMHGRAAFVVSCLLLVIMGASLGMMFRSGNFLTAFAVSVVPAMFSTVLIVTGQHTAESTPTWVTAANNPLHAGIMLIWVGNVVIGIAGVVLLWRLQRR
jgi:lipopolysaccharide export system permease protein